MERSTYRTEYSWSGPVGTAARLASALKGWQKVRFEVTEEPTATTEGERYSYTPSLGIFHAVDRHARRHHGAGGPAPARRGPGHARRRRPDRALDGLLGTSLGHELEPFRHAGDGTPVRWLHEVV